MKIANKEMKKQYKNINIDHIEVRCWRRKKKLKQLVFYLDRMSAMTWKT